MGIDRVGKDGPYLPVPELGGPTGARSSEAAFEVPKVTHTSPAAKIDPACPPSLVEPTPAVSRALERLCAGELDFHGYVEATVHEATAHLSGLPPVELENIRSALRERLAGDPTLIDLLQTATGETLSTDDE